MLNNHGKETLEHIENDLPLNKYRKDFVKKLLENYIRLFNEMVVLDYRLGIKDNSGLKKELETQMGKINVQIKTLNKK